MSYDSEKYQHHFMPPNSLIINAEVHKLIQALITLKYFCSEIHDDNLATCSLMEML
jgi:hypothetical protein